MTRIYERQRDAVFAAALAGNPDFARSFLNAVDRRPELLITSVRVQTPHRGEGHRGTIDLEVTRGDGSGSVPGGGVGGRARSLRRSAARGRG